MVDDDLNKRIADAKAKQDPPRSSARESAKGASLGFRMASDFTAAVIVGAGLGWGSDALFGWSPWGLIVCLMLGFVTGVRNVVMAAQQANAASPDSGSRGLEGSTEPGRNENAAQDAEAKDE